MTLSIEGDEERGFWINLGPGALRVSPMYTSAREARSMLVYHQRTCGVRPCPQIAKESS